VEKRSVITASESIPVRLQISAQNIRKGGAPVAFFRERNGGL
jgi:hypothetical protein